MTAAALDFLGRAERVARQLGVRAGRPYEPADCAADALVLWLGRDRAGGTAWTTVRRRVIDALRAEVGVHRAPPQFVGLADPGHRDTPEALVAAAEAVRDWQPSRLVVRCSECGAERVASRRSAKTCSARCRKRRSVRLRA